MVQAGKPKNERGWREAFLEHLSRSSNVAAAARAAGIDVSTVYKTRRQEKDFASHWFAALCDGYDNLELELLRRLRNGDTENTTAKRKKKFDNATAFRLLTAHRDTVSRERARRSDQDEDTINASIDAKLDVMRERMREAGDAAQQQDGDDGLAA